MTDETRTDDDCDALEDATLGGYLEKHNRPPGFEGADGQPYTVSIEAERTSNLRAPWEAYLVFPRWAETGLGIVGHVETSAIAEGRTREEVTGRVAGTPLLRVKELLDEAIARGRGGEGGDGR
jgi:hypothetical protein